MALLGGWSWGTYRIRPVRRSRRRSGLETLSRLDHHTVCASRPLPGALVHLWLPVLELVKNFVQLLPSLTRGGSARLPGGTNPASSNAPLDEPRPQKPQLLGDSWGTNTDPQRGTGEKQ